MAGAAAPRVELQIAQGGKPWGAIVIELDEAKAPLSAANFLKYVESGYYDGTIFHRVIPTFMIQGGGYTAPNASKAGGFAAIKNEAKNGLKNTRGTLAMARTSDPHSATSQFFVNVDDNDFLDHPGQDGWGYCVFGKVVAGIEIVDRIKDVPTKRNPQMGENSQPVDPPVIVSAKRVAQA